MTRLAEDPVQRLEMLGWRQVMPRWAEGLIWARV